MTSTTLRSIIVGSLSAIVFANCGSDPYSGEGPSSTDTGTDTKTRTATDTTTPGATDTDTGTKTVTGTGTPSTTGTETTSITRTITHTNTDTGSATKTDTGTPSGTGTATDTRTSTDTQTQTGKPDAGQPDVPIVTETLTYTQTRTTTVVTKDGGTTDAGPGVIGDPDGGVRLISVAPVRQLDLVFMIDNSPSMAPKIEKMRQNFPRLLTALKDPSDGTYPDLRVAIIDSDLGSGGQYASGSCGPNDSNNRSSYGDLGNFQMRDASGCGVNDGALWLEYTKGRASNYDGKQDIGNVFGCLASNLGTLGCGLEHSLQSFEFALIAQSGDIPGRNSKQDEFLRSTAHLGLVYLSDEDDCSAATNDGIFGDSNHPELKGESASLRCATRSHMCSGQNLADSGPGYPTTASFSTLLTNCQARTDACPNPTDGAGSTDTTNGTSCSPLKNIKHMADELKDLKRGDPEKLLVAGIFGWPRSDADMATAEYKIDQVPNPNSQDTAHPKVWDYWPVCYDPNHMPQSSGFDQAAWGWGAQGGLRLSAFIDEFGANGQKYSICEPDFSVAMKGIGDALARKLTNLCISSDYTTGKACSVSYWYLSPDVFGNVEYTVGEYLPTCPSDATNGNVDQDCWRLVSDQTVCPGAALRAELLRTKAEIGAGPLNPGTQLAFDCK